MQWLFSRGNFFFIIIKTKERKIIYLYDIKNREATTLTLLGLGGGQYCPPNLVKTLKQKPFESLIYNFLTIPKYVYTLTSN